MVEDLFATKMWTAKARICIWCHSFWPSDFVTDVLKKEQGSHMTKTAIIQVNNHLFLVH